MHYLHLFWFSHSFHLPSFYLFLQSLRPFCFSPPSTFLLIPPSCNSSILPESSSSLPPFSLFFHHVIPSFFRNPFFPSTFFLIHSYIYSTTKHEILQISNHYLLCSLDPPNQGWLFWVVGPKLIKDTDYNWLHISRHVFGLSGDLWQGEMRGIFM